MMHYILSAPLHRASRWSYDASCMSWASLQVLPALPPLPNCRNTSHRTTRLLPSALSHAGSWDRTKAQRFCISPECVIAPLWILYREITTGFGVLLSGFIDKYKAGFCLGQGVLLKTGLYSLKVGAAWGLEVVEGSGAMGWSCPPSGLLSCSVPSTMENPLGVSMTFITKELRLARKCLSLFIDINLKAGHNLSGGLWADNLIVASYL